MNSLAPEIRFFEAEDGYRGAVRVWPQRDPLGCIVCVHGIVSHGAWYLSSCRYLAQAGFEVHFVERRGSGLNLREPGDVNRYETWLDDIEGYLSALPKNVPRLLFGISWGGKLAAAVARHRPKLLAGIGLLCPGLFAKQFPSRLKYTALDVARRCGLANKRVTIPLQDPALFTESPALQEYVRRDPLTLRKVTVRFALEDRKLTGYATEAPQEITVPVFVALAGKERIVDNGRVRRFFDQLGSPEKQLIEYPEAAHTLEFEPDPSKYFADLVRWSLDACALSDAEPKSPDETGQNKLHL